MITSRYVEISIGDLFQKKQLDFIQFVIVSRYLDVKNYIEKGDTSFKYQSILSNKKEQSDQQNVLFRSLIEEIRERGLSKKYPVEIDKNCCLEDGTHRVAIGLYFKQMTIRAKYLRRESVYPPLSIFNIISRDEVSMGFMKDVAASKRAIIDMLFEQGYSMCCVVSSVDNANMDDFINNLKLFCTIYRVIKNKTEYDNNGSYIIIQFYVDNPYYVFRHGYVYSRTVDNLERFFSTRYAQSSITKQQWAHNCIEGKRLFDIFFNK